MLPLQRDENPSNFHIIVRRVATFALLILATFASCGSKVSGRTMRSLSARGFDGSYESQGRGVVSNNHERKPSHPKTYSGWNLSLITSTRQLDAWRERVARAENGRFEDEEPVRVFVSHGRWMTRTSAPSTLLPDGSLSISDCSIPCAVEFNKDERREEQTLSYPDTFDWTPWTTSPSVRAADVVMQVDLPWDARQLRQFRAIYPRKRAVFACWEPLGTAHRTVSALSARRYDWLASFTFGGENAADVPSTYEGLDHSDGAVAEFHQKRRRRGAEFADGLFFRGRAKYSSMTTWKQQRVGADSAAISSRSKASSFCRGAQRPVFMAVSNCASKQRQRLLSAFMEVLPVDSYGICLHNSKLSNDLLPGCTALQSKDWREQKACMMSCYPFVLSIESTHSELDYVTEKLFDPLEHESIIPIYLGPPNEREFLPHPSAAILVRDFSSRKRGKDDVVVDEETMRRVARYVVSISRNASAMQQLQSWRTELAEDSFNVGGRDDHRERRKSTTKSDKEDKQSEFPFALRSWFSHRHFFCNLCTRYAAESVGILGYEAGA